MAVSFRRGLLIFALLFPALLHGKKGQTDIVASVGVFAPILDVTRIHDTHASFTGTVRHYFWEDLALEVGGTALSSSNGHKEAGGGLHVIYNLETRWPRLQPYALIGVDIFHAYPPLRNSSTTVCLGLGAKIYFLKRVFIAPEARIGVALRASAGVGFTWGR